MCTLQFLPSSSDFLRDTREAYLDSRDCRVEEEGIKIPKGPFSVFGKLFSDSCKQESSSEQGSVHSPWFACGKSHLASILMLWGKSKLKNRL